MPALASLGKDVLWEAEAVVSKKQGGGEADLLFIIILNDLQIPYLCASLVTASAGSLDRDKFQTNCLVYGWWVCAQVNGWVGDIVTCG